MDARTPAMDGSIARCARLVAAIATVLLVLLSAGGHAAADEVSGDASARWPVQGAAIQTALAIAVDHWGLTPCGGAVAVAWQDPGQGDLARSTWTNPIDPYLQPSRNTDCRIDLSPGAPWTWPMLCTILVHEVGHLDGQRHSDDPQDVMYPSYTVPLLACAQTPEPTGPATVPAIAAAAPPPAAATRTAARAPARRSKRPGRHAPRLHGRGH